MAELNPHGSEPASDIPGSLFVPGSVSDAAFVRSRSAPIPKSGVQPGPTGSIFALKMSETRLSSGRSTGSSPPIGHVYTGDVDGSRPRPDPEALSFDDQLKAQYQYLRPPTPRPI